MAYIPRVVDALLDELLAEVPAVLLAGPRACGKTTTARRRAADVLALDVAGDATVTRADPDGQLAVRGRPLLIDEWQQVPEVLGAVKRAVDASWKPNQFLLTGSTSADLGSAGWPATGRVVRVPLWPLIEREIEGHATSESVLDRLTRDSVETLRTATATSGARDYVERALRGGQPRAAAASDRVRLTVLASHVDQLTGHDIAAIGLARDPVRLRAYLRACAANTAGVVHHKTLYDAAGVSRATGVTYDDVLAATFVIDPVPAWSGGRLSRIVSTPKRYLVDTSLLSPLLGVDTRAVLRDPDLLGRVLDTLVAAQLRAEASVAAPGMRLHHLRDVDGRHEVDLLVELANGDIIAFEIKATTSPEEHDARHLRWLRQRLGERLIAAVVLHTGPGTIIWSEWLAAAPISALWST